MSRGGREARGGTKPGTPVPPLVLLTFWLSHWPRPSIALRCSNSGLDGIRLQRVAKPRICRGFACIRLQSGGGNRQKSVPPPVFIGNLQPDAPLQRPRRRRACTLRVDQPNLKCAKRGGKRRNPNKKRGWHAVRLRRATPCLPATLKAMLCLISARNYAS